jgi:hypothetical protein
MPWFIRAFLQSIAKLLAFATALYRGSPTTVILLSVRNFL